jgi:hypothetical protein
MMTVAVRNFADRLKIHLVQPLGRFIKIKVEG